MLRHDRNVGLVISQMSREGGSESLTGDLISIFSEGPIPVFTRAISFLYNTEVTFAFSISLPRGATV